MRIRASQLLFGNRDRFCLVCSSKSRVYSIEILKLHNIYWFKWDFLLFCVRFTIS